jgi:hypothetical protein
LLGIVTGVFGVLFNRSLLITVEMYARLPARFVIPVAAITGGIIGLVGWFSPLMMGSGHTLAESALKGDLLLATIPLFFLIRFFLTTTSYGTGAPGGIFAPLLVLGALIGLAIGQIAHNLSPDIVPIPAVFAVVGMAAYFTAIVRAPLTGIMLIVEMTGNYSQMLPLLVGCFCAYAVTEFLKDLPIYEALLERDLKRGGEVHLLKEPVVVEFIIQADAPFVGLEVRSLGLPSGCILVRCSDGKREWVPKANTRLEAHMRITAMVAPEASSGLEILRQGCQALKQKRANTACTGQVRAVGRTFGESAPKADSASGGFVRQIPLLPVTPAVGRWRRINFKIKKYGSTFMLRTLTDKLYSKDSAVKWFKSKNPDEEIVFSSAATILETKEATSTGWSLQRLFQHRGVVIVTQNQIALKDSLFSISTIFFSVFSHLFNNRDYSGNHRHESRQIRIACEYQT